jgi:hypothetical protein
MAIYSLHEKWGKYHYIIPEIVSHDSTFKKLVSGNIIDSRKPSHVEEYRFLGCGAV